ncbi:M28 family peptidase [Luteimonas sp. MC1895]|uniref:M28 family peptidase n=1 Tax=Luteimonas sp. MC1895 TaxID=2819513 RepID=UPI0018F07016|nr:M28 family peptidase [Luteimonas sp. MC1895]MBJ6978596.1 M28 family peptidase [Luteimonas sp. MC1895]
MRLVPILLATAIAAALPSTAIAHGARSSADGVAAGRTPATSAPSPLRVAETRISDASMAVAAQLRETALASSLAWDITESLTTEVGPRLAGSEADARAVAWAQAKFAELGFDRVWTEPVTFPKWVRRSERAEVLGASAQPLVITALGGSPAGMVEAEVVRFADLAALEAAPAGSLAGRIAFVDYRMERARDGSGYGPGSRVRSRGPSAAIRAGASGFLMRSAGTDSHRNPHTGITRFDEGLEPVPSAALSVPDADQLARLLARGPVRLRLALDCGWDGEYTSQNVIGEMTGASRPDEVVLIGGHLDSWDLGTGAVDDAAGIGITLSAAVHIAALSRRPARSIRVVAFANEEQGLHGGNAYAAAHGGEVARHQLVAESDFGAGRIYGFNTGAPAHARAAAARIAEALAPLGIAPLDQGGPGPDVIAISRAGATWAWLGQDGSDYFDLHHTPDDTLDKIDPAALAQNAAAYAVFAYLAADAEGDFGSAPASTAAPD